MKRRQPPATEQANETTGATAAAATDQLADGRCPNGCHSYSDKTACACGEGHTLPSQQFTVHLGNEHWHAVCAAGELASGLSLARRTTLNQVVSALEAADGIGSNREAIAVVEGLAR